MFDYAQYAPLIVPIFVGLILLRLVFGLLLAHTKRGAERAQAVRRSWGQFTTTLFFAAVLLPIIKTSVGLSIDTSLFWPLLIMGGIAGTLHNAALATRNKAAGMLGENQPTTKPTAKPNAKAAASKPAGAAKAANTPQPAPLVYGSETQSLDRAISQAPFPKAQAGRAEPMTNERAEVWYALQDARLQAGLQGKELAAARLRLSTLKSMLLLGQIGRSEADGDVSTILQLRRAR